jgi:hypothetical protein
VVIAAPHRAKYVLLQVAAGLLMLCVLQLSGPASGQTRLDDLRQLVVTAIDQQQSTSAWTTSDLRRIQALLNSAGYDAGREDGRMGPRTKRAIESFQRDHALPETGAPSAALLSALQAIEGAGSSKSRFQIFHDTDLPYSDYRSGMDDPELRDIGLGDCQRICSDDGRCGSFTYNSQHRVCFLKIGVPQRAPFVGAVSGVKQDDTRESSLDPGSALSADLQRAATGAETAPTTGRFSILRDTDLPHSDYRSGLDDPELRDIGLGDCQGLCADDGRCGSFTYNSQHRVCFLKIGVPPSTHFAGAISGVKQSESPAALVAEQLNDPGSGAAEHPSAAAVKTAEASSAATDAEVGAAVRPAVSPLEATPAYENAAEPTHAALLDLYLRANADILSGEYLALENYTTFHVDIGHFDGPRARSSDECRAISDLERNEVAFEEFVERAKTVLESDLAAKTGAPDKAIFRLVVANRLGDYDAQKQAFPFWRSGRGPLFDDRFTVSRTAFHGYRSSDYRGERENLCAFHPSGVSSTWSGRVFWPGRFSIELPRPASIESLPMSRTAAKALVEGSPRREVQLELLIEVGPFTFAARNPAVFPARVIAARALEPESGRVLHVYDLPERQDTTVAEAATHDNTTSSVLRRHHLDLVVAKLHPELISDETITALAERQIGIEQRVWEEVQQNVERGTTSATSTLHPDHPLLLFSWQREIKTRPEFARTDLARIFAHHDADWAFLESEPRYDPRFEQIIRAFVFDPEAISGREPSFIARELAPLFRRHLEAAAQHVPERFFILEELPSVSYDFDSKSFRFGESYSERVPPGVSLASRDTSDPAATGQFAYVVDQLPTERADETANPGRRSNSDRLPSIDWRQQVVSSLLDSETGRLGRAILAFDRALSIDAISVEPAEAEAVSRQLSGSSNLTARLAFRISRVERDVSSETGPRLVFFAELGGVEILLPDGSLLAALPPEAFPTVDALLRQDAERRRVIMPAVAAKNDRARELTAKTMELLVAEHHADRLDDALVERMMITRWHYEDSARREKRALDDGEVFIRRDRAEPEMVPLPEGEQRAETVAAFRQWIIAQAATLPSQIIVELAVQTPEEGFYPPGRHLPMASEGTESSCARRVHVLRQNNQAHEAAMYETACAFIREAEEIPHPVVACSATSGFSGERWHCSRDREYFRALVVAARDVSAAPRRDVFLRLDKAFEITADTVAAAEGKSTAIRFVAEVASVEAVDSEEDASSPAIARALEAANEFVSRDGLDGLGSVNEKGSGGPSWNLELNVLEAELVDTETGQTVAPLSVADIPDLPLHMLERPGPVGPDPLAGPYGPDVFGIRLGMTFDEADELIRQTMAVEHVLVADRRWSVGAVLSEEDMFTSGRLYVSSDRRQIVVLYDEPPTARGIVTGAAFQILTPNAPGADKSIFARLQQKYGAPDLWEENAIRPGLSPWWIENYEHPENATRPWAGNNWACMAASYWNFNLNQIWRDEHGGESPVLSESRFDRIPELRRGGSDHANSSCSVAVTATVDTKTYTDTALNIWLFDHWSYSRLFEESREVPVAAALSPEHAAGMSGSDAEDPLHGLLSPSREQGDASGLGTGGQPTRHDSGGVMVAERQIASGVDDVEQVADSRLYFDSSDLELVDDHDHNGAGQTVGLRFTDVAVPQGATIIRATIGLVARPDQFAEPTALTIAAIDADDAAPFNSLGEGGLSSLATLPDTVGWDAEPWMEPYGTYHSPDLAVLIQRVVSRTGWQSGNSMGFLIGGTGLRGAHAYDGDPSMAPVLRIEYRLPGAASPVVDLDWSTTDDWHDVVGLRLGMSFDDADRIVRQEMQVGRTYRADPGWGSRTPTGGIAPLTSGRMYVSEDESEVIVIYDEPPAASRRVVAVLRQQRLPKGAVPRQSVLERLQSKYGPEITTREIGFESALVWFRHADGMVPGEYTFQERCNPLELTMFDLSAWRNDDGSGITEARRFVTGPMPKLDADSVLAVDESANCGAGFAAAFVESDTPEWDSLNIWLYDMNNYAVAYEAGRAVPSQTPAASAGVDIKL